MDGIALATATLPVGNGGRGMDGIALATAKLEETARTAPKTMLLNFNDVEIMCDAPCV
jgi:hypothetical protein